MGTNAHKQSQLLQQKPTCSHQSRTYWTFSRVARLVPRCVVTAIYGNRERRIQKYFLSSWKKNAKPRNNFTTMTFGKSLFITQYRMHTSECKIPHNRTYDGYLWKPAKRNKVRTSKQLQFAASTKTFNGNQAQGQTQQTNLKTIIYKSYQHFSTVVRLPREWWNKNSQLKQKYNFYQQQTQRN